MKLFSLTLVLGLLYVVALCPLQSAEQLAGWDGLEPKQGGVSVSVHLPVGAGAETAASELIIKFDALSDFLNTYHLYPADSTEGVPLAIALEGARQIAPFTTAAKTKLIPEGAKVFAVSQIEVRLPIILPETDTDVKLIFSYLACSDQNQCKQAVFNKALELRLPGVGAAAVAAAEAALGTSSGTETAPSSNDAVQDVQQQQATKHLENTKATGINWQHVKTVEEVESLIAATHASGETVFLDFTGPSCINCQDMAKNVLVLPEIRDAWNSGVAIEINTDASSELAQWQLDTFDTYTRPLYVRLDPAAEPVLWSTYIKAGNTEKVADLLAFLNGGAGEYTGSGDTWLQFIILAVLGGLFTLVMPCTYPMIPLTVNFFNKQAASGRKILPLALAYALGILLSFTLLGVIVGVVLGQAITNISGDPWVNFGIGVVFIVLGLSLMGVFFLRLPSGLTGRVGSGQMGYLGALLMGLTFAVTAFTCTAPFAGAVLAEGAKSGSVIKPAIGMLLYASMIAIPFFFLSLSPRLVERMPRAGSWMNEFKFVGGIIEIAAAFKFLAISDYAWGWGGVFGRTSSLAAWVLLSLLAAIYLAGLIRLSGDDKIAKFGIGRLAIIALFLASAVYLSLGLFGHQHLGLLESFFPGDAAPV